MAAVSDQQSIFNHLIRLDQNEFGKEHQFNTIKSYEDFAKHVPVRDYEAFRPYIDKVKSGKHNILLEGPTNLFCQNERNNQWRKIYNISQRNHSQSLSMARNALLCYMAETGNTRFADGKLIFLSGSPELERVGGGIPTGRLSGIVNHHVPKYLRANQFAFLRNQLH